MDVIERPTCVPLQQRGFMCSTHLQRGSKGRQVAKLRPIIKWHDRPNNESAWSSRIREVDTGEIVNDGGGMRVSVTSFKTVIW